MKMHEAQFIYIFSIYLIIFFSFIMITDIIILFFGFMPLSLSLSLSLSSTIYPHHATLLIFHYGGVSGIVLVPHFIIYRS
jgi:hypothetical protein